MSVSACVKRHLMAKYLLIYFIDEFEPSVCIFYLYFAYITNTFNYFSHKFSLFHLIIIIINFFFSVYLLLLFIFCMLKSICTIKDLKSNHLFEEKYNGINETAEKTTGKQEKSREFHIVLCMRKGKKFKHLSAYCFIEGKKSAIFLSRC